MNIIYFEKVPNDSLPEERKKLIKSWWLFSFQCIQLKIKKPHRKFLLQWSKDVISYRKVYEHILINRFNQAIYPTSVTETTVSNQEKTYKLPDDLQDEKQRIENEWSLERLSLIRRVIFEKFIKNPIFKEYFVKLKQNNSLNQTDAANSGLYSYMSWSFTNLKGYYYGKILKTYYK